MIANTRPFFVLVVFAALFLPSFRTYAETTPIARIEGRLDIPVGRALDTIFDMADLEERSLPASPRARHDLRMAAVHFTLADRLGMRVGVGLAALLDSPTAHSPMRRGCALAGSLALALFEQHGFRFGVEVSALRVAYDHTTVDEGTVLLALSGR
jgi:hypothetical protein